MFSYTYEEGYPHKSPGVTRTCLEGILHSPRIFFTKNDIIIIYHVLFELQFVREKNGTFVVVLLVVVLVLVQMEL